MNFVVGDIVRAIHASAPHLAPSSVRLWADAILPALAGADITQPRRLAGFVGQCAVESDYFTSTSENLRYTHAQRICAVWPGRFPLVSMAIPFVNNPQALANRVYSQRMGNGDDASGDGWKFRGRGLIQITGHETYAAFAASIGMSIDDAAAYAATSRGAVASAAWFWTKSKINPPADAWDLPRMTFLINGGETNLDDRVTACNAALAALSAPGQSTAG